MIQIKQATSALHLVFFLADKTDHVTGLSGLSPSVFISKNGGSFAGPAGGVSEIGSGFYMVAGHATDTDTLGVLALYATATGADPAAMAYAVVANIQSDAITSIAALHDLSAAQVRSELATELGRIDVATSTRLATAGYTAPANPAAIADAVADELIADHTITGSVGAALASAGAAGDPLSIVVPGTYAADTAGAAIGRLLTVPAENPIALAPLPPDNPDLCLVYVDTETMTGTALTGLTIIIEVATARPIISAAGRVISRSASTMFHDSDHPGRYAATLEAGLSYRPRCLDLWPAGHTFDVPAGSSTLNLAEA